MAADTALPSGPGVRTGGSVDPQRVGYVLPEHLVLDFLADAVLIHQGLVVVGERSETGRPALAPEDQLAPIARPDLNLEDFFVDDARALVAPVGPQAPEPLSAIVLDRR